VFCVVVPRDVKEESVPREVEAADRDPVEVLNRIAGNLGRISNLLAILAVKGYEDDDDRIRILDSAGFTPVEIGSLLGKRPNTISVALYRARKRRG
jgi:hypothetical protein